MQFLTGTIDAALGRRILGCACVLSALLLGCGPRISDFIPITNAFGYVRTEGGIDQAPSAGLYYRGSDGKPVFLCFIRDKPFFNGDMAILIGELQGSTEDKLIAVKGSGPAIDITEGALNLGAKEQHKDARTLLESYGYPHLAWKDRDPNGLLPEYGLSASSLADDECVVMLSVNDPENRNHMAVTLNWQQISNLVSSVAGKPGK